MCVDRCIALGCRMSCRRWCCPAAASAVASTAVLSSSLHHAYPGPLTQAEASQACTAAGGSLASNASITDIAAACSQMGAGCWVQSVCAGAQCTAGPTLVASAGSPAYPAQASTGGCYYVLPGTANPAASANRLDCSTAAGFVCVISDPLLPLRPAPPAPSPAASTGGDSLSGGECRGSREGGREAGCKSLAWLATVAFVPWT